MKEVIVVGGGVIGLCVAEKLASAGHGVTIVEKAHIAAGASYGNAAGLAFSEVMPMASAGVIWQSIRGLVDPNGQFSVVPQDLPYTMGWLLQFALAARRPVVERSLRVQSQLMQVGQSTLPLMLERSNLEHLVRTTGALYLYDTERQYNAALAGWELRAQHGVAYDCYTGQALHDFQSGLSSKIYGGMHAPGFQGVTDPNEFCLSIHRHLTERGIETIYQKVIAVESHAQGVSAILESSPPLKADKAIIAAGPWSGELCKLLGDKVPLIGERGYNTTLPKAAFPELDKIFFFGPHGFVISALHNGVRVGGASEIASIEREPNYRRSEVMLRKAKELVPALQLMDGEQWMGVRPTIPDSLPVIGPATQHPDVIYAFGHGHLGLTQATATAQLVHELVNGEAASVDIAELSVSRF